MATVSTRIVGKSEGGQQCIFLLILTIFSGGQYKLGGRGPRLPPPPTNRALATVDRYFCFNNILKSSMIWSRFLLHQLRSNCAFWFVYSFFTLHCDYEAFIIWIIETIAFHTCRPKNSWRRLIYTRLLFLDYRCSPDPAERALTCFGYSGELEFTNEWNNGAQFGKKREYELGENWREMYYSRSIGVIGEPSRISYNLARHQTASITLSRLWKTTCFTRDRERGNYFFAVYCD